MFLNRDYVEFVAACEARSCLVTSFVLFSVSLILFVAVIMRQWGAHVTELVVLAVVTFFIEAVIGLGMLFVRVCDLNLLLLL